MNGKTHTHRHTENTSYVLIAQILLLFEPFLFLSTALLIHSAIETETETRMEYTQYVQLKWRFYSLAL